MCLRHTRVYDEGDQPQPVRGHMHDHQPGMTGAPAHPLQAREVKGKVCAGQGASCTCCDGDLLTADHCARFSTTVLCMSSAARILYIEVRT